MGFPRTESNRGPIDYKSIALPAELQGHNFLRSIFSRKDQLNQSKKNEISKCKALKNITHLFSKIKFSKGTTQIYYT